MQDDAFEVEVMLQLEEAATSLQAFGPRQDVEEAEPTIQQQHCC